MTLSRKERALWVSTLHAALSGGMHSNNARETADMVVREHRRRLPPSAWARVRGWFAARPMRALRGDQ